MSVTGRLKFELCAGRWVRQPMMREIRSICHVRGLMLDVSEDRGFFNSHYYVTIIGPMQSLEDLKELIEKLPRTL